MPSGITIKNTSFGSHKYKAFDKVDNDSVVFEGLVGPGQSSYSFDLAPDEVGRGKVSVEVSGMTGMGFYGVQDGQVLNMD